jgi:hypothetical protein
VIADVIRNGMPKWRARHVTVSPSVISPDVTPATARSPDGPIDAVCASTDRLRAKQSATGAAMTVSIRNDGTGSA